jgi:hypothetical protein
MGKLGTRVKDEVGLLQPDCWQPLNNPYSLKQADIKPIFTTTVEYATGDKVKKHCLCR